MSPATGQQVVVSALYHFVTLDNYQALRQPLYDFMIDNEIKGTLLLADEGINGTIAGSQTSIDKLHVWLRSDERLKDLRTKESYDDKEQGFEEVYHLQGGILKYLETVPEADSMWQGECFVFDNRVSVDHNLEKGAYHQCHACRLPITEEDKKSEKYVQGVNCPYYYDKKTEKQCNRFAERERQVQLAKSRGEEHIGSAVNEISRQRKHMKDVQRENNRRSNQVHR